MNTIPAIQSEITMDSREIARLTNKDHGHVCRDIQEMLSRLNGLNQSSFGSVYRAGNGEERKCYALPYRETMILVSGYSIELRARIVDRWLELERQGHLFLVPLPDFSNPVAAARAWADEAEKRQLAEKQIEDQAPKVAYADEICSTDSGIPLGDFAHVLASRGWEIGRTRLFKLLLESKVLYEEYSPQLKKTIVQPYQTEIEADRFLTNPVRVTKFNAIYPQVLITPKGQKYVIAHHIEWEVKRLVKNDMSKEKAS
jgi:phage antirepressor YoqD-like protein